MKKELKKRIITSILLIVLGIFSILIHKNFFLLTSLVALCFCAIEWNNLNLKYARKNKFKFHLIAWIGFFYLFFVLYSIKNLRGDSFEEAIFLIFILSICVGSDVGGYTFGKIIGGKKLIKISPKKTISGSAGSFIFALIPLYLFNFEISFKYISFCLILSLFSQVGDLTISYFKRLHKVKDTGNLLPGHGGLLDRFDGIIFAVPIAYIFKILQII